MSRALFTPNAAEHLAKIAGMFGSAHDGERASAARLADEFVRRLGLTWRDVLATPPEWQMMARYCRDLAHCLTDRERDFINNIAKLRKPPSDAQVQWLRDIFERLKADARSRGDAW